MDVYCHCGRKALMLTSWTDLNPGRRFWTCGHRSHPCRFFLWFDPPMYHRSVQIIPGLLERIKEYEGLKGPEAKLRRQGTNCKVLWVVLLIILLMLVWVVAFGKLEEESLDGHGRNNPTV